MCSGLGVWVMYDMLCVQGAYLDYVGCRSGLVFSQELIPPILETITYHYVNFTLELNKNLEM